MSDPITIDCDYFGPEFAAAYLLVEGDETAFVEANTTHAVPRLLRALEHAGRTAESVRYVIVTHVHLDHAGGASALMQACPNATVLAHPRAARHLVDPSRLVASARSVYGDAQFDALYGRIDPIDEARVRVMQDEETLEWGARRLRFLHTRGHANHHFVVHDSKSDAVFSGDAFGLCYPALQTNGLFILPSTSPTDFDPDAARQSVHRIARTGTRVFLTHYGEVKEVEEAAAELDRHLVFSGELLERAVVHEPQNESVEDFCKRELWAHYERTVQAKGFSFTTEQWNILRVDLELNAQGIAFVAKKRQTAG